MEETGSSSLGASGASGSSDSLNGLKFGKKIYFEDVGIGTSAKSGCGSASDSVSERSAPVARSAPPPKKGRASLQGGQPPWCQVEGCMVDLTGAKPYYSRHKVCATHSKSPKVIVAGIEQRFCQQCSRFHQLPEFDQGKRSCRRRLAGHNERRRKPVVRSFSSSRYGQPYSSLQGSSNRAGSFLMDFTTYPRPPARDIWPTLQAGDSVPHNQSAPVGKVLPYTCQGSSENPQGINFLYGLAGGTVFPSPGLPLSECFAGVPASSRALSLLSSQPWGSRNRDLSVNHLMNDGVASLAQFSAPHGAGTSNFTSSTWCFKGNEDSSSSHEMPHNLGPDQDSQPVNIQFSGEPEFTQQSSRQYTQHMLSRDYGSATQQPNWSL